MVVDTSHCIQRGRTPARSRSDFTNQVFDLWYRCSALNLSYDIYIAAYLDSMRIAIQLLELVQPDRSNPDSWEVRVHLFVCLFRPTHTTALRSLTSLPSCGSMITRSRSGTVTGSSVLWSSTIPRTGQVRGCPSALNVDSFFC